MGFTDIINYKLINAESFTLTAYHLLIICCILVATRVLLGVLRRIFKRQESKGKLEIGKSRSIYQIIKYLAWIAAISFALDTIGIKITFLIASSAALLVGLGLGMQKIFQDFISGIALLIEGTLKVGDIVQTDSGEIGKVKEIGLRTSKLETRDNIIVIMPNSELINKSLINWSHNEKRTRFNISVGVAYGSDVQLVKKLLLECAKEHPQVVNEPKPTVRFSDFGNSSLDFELLFWTNQTFRVEDVKSDMRFTINKMFQDNKVTIPFPQRDVHLYKH